jgi:hypothetical protein
MTTDDPDGDAWAAKLSDDMDHALAAERSARAAARRGELPTTDKREIYPQDYLRSPFDELRQQAEAAARDLLTDIPELRGVTILFDFPGAINDQVDPVWLTRGREPDVPAAVGMGLMLHKALRAVVARQQSLLASVQREFEDGLKAARDAWERAAK